MASEHLKVVVLGAACQGKSALVLRFVSGIFIPEYDPTIEEIYQKLVMVNDSPITLDIIDSAGQEEFASMIDLWIEEGHIFLLVYSVTSDAESASPDILTPFDHCRLLHNKIVEIKDDKNTPCIIVGTKVDLPRDERNHRIQDGESMAKQFGSNCRYMEVSAKNGSNLETLWNTVAADGRAYIFGDDGTVPNLAVGGESSLNSNNSHRGRGIMCCCPSMPSISNVGSKMVSGNTPGSDSQHTSYHQQVSTLDLDHEATPKSDYSSRLSTELTAMGSLTAATKDIVTIMDAVRDQEEEEEDENEETALKDTVDNEDEEEMVMTEIVQNTLTVPVAKTELKSNTSTISTRSINSSRFGSAQIQSGHPIKVFPVRKTPRDKIFEPILSSKNFKIHRKFSCSRFVIAIFCGLMLPIILALQTMAFLLYHEGKMGGFYYPKQYKYSDIHHSILLDFMGIIVGRHSDQDPEIEKDRRWFLRQSAAQKVLRILVVVYVIILYGTCVYNIKSVHFEDSSAADELNVSLMESLGPSLLLAVIWILLSLWIANEQTLTPKLPPLAKLRSINLYFGDHFKQTTSAYKFLRGYIALKEDGWTMSWTDMAVIFLLSLFYACIPGLTRLTVGDTSDNLEDREFMSLNEMRVELGALIVNCGLMCALMYTVEVQYRKHIEYYKVWMQELTMFLMEKESKPEHHQLDDDLDDELSYEPPSQSDEFKSKYFPQNLYLSLKRRSNALGWMEIRSFLACEGKLFFGEQELPILWILVISMMITLFTLYRAFFGTQDALQSVLFNGMSVLTIICWSALIKMSFIASQFEHLQFRQEALVETQKLIMRCDDTFGISEDELSDDDLDGDDAKRDVVHSDDDHNNGGIGNEQKPLLLRGGLRKQHFAMEMRWYSRNIGFIEDLLSVIQRRSIFPMLFRTKLNSVLIPIIAMITVSGILVSLKLFSEILLLE